jgi:hypothetical protein
MALIGGGEGLVVTLMSLLLMALMSLLVLVSLLLRIL